MLALIVVLLSSFNSLEAQDQTLLYEISGNDLKNPSYVFGTIHIMCQEELTFSAEIISALKATEQIAFELDLDDPQLLAKLQTGFMLDEGTSLSTFYSEDKYALIKKYLTNSFGQNAEALSTMKPFFITSMLYPQYMGCQTASMEASLMGLKSSDQEVLGLETVEEQLRAINTLPIDYQATLLLEAIENFDEQRDQFMEMLDLYRSKDMEALYALADHEFNEMDGFSKVILDQRNQNWIPEMIQLMEQKPTFFAVGVAHLGGVSGVLNLLDKAGYKVKPVNRSVQVDDQSKLGEYGNLILGRWKIDEQYISEIADEAIETAIDSNPQIAEQILAQRPVVEEMVRNTVKRYNEDGSTLVTVPNGGGTQQGTWRIDEDNGLLIETDNDGEENIKRIIELSDTTLVTEKEGEKRRIFHRIDK